ncbi:MAG: hypothetical protein RL179_2974 [Planctomycetota bacterium]|jgi:hypothetical protein
MNDKINLKKAVACMGIFLASTVFGQEGVWNGASRPVLTAGGASIGAPISMPVKTNSNPIILTQGVDPSPVPPGALTPGVPPAVPGNPPPPPPPPSGFGSPPPSGFGNNQPFIPGSTGMPLDRPANNNLNFLDSVREYTGNGPFSGSTSRKLFESDHAFDNFASPTTNLFLFEDPRALTEIRPLYMFQTIPGSNATLQGGTVNYLGAQARVAITERISFVINKFGWISLNPTDQQDGFNGDLSFSELWLGPKWTFWRDEKNNLVAATGLTFEIPSGPQRAFQNTGNLSLTPYISAAHSFGRSSYGSFDVLSVLNWNISTTNARSNYLNLSAQLDYDVLNWHRFYPMVNFNWFIYTKGGQSQFNFDGVDLVNFGGQSIGGKSVVTLGPGLRYKWTEKVQSGIGLDWAVVGNQFLQDFRMSIDTIIRY